MRITITKCSRELRMYRVMKQRFFLAPTVGNHSKNLRDLTVSLYENGAIRLRMFHNILDGAIHPVKFQSLPKTQMLPAHSMLLFITSDLFCSNLLLDSSGQKWKICSLRTNNVSGQENLPRSVTPTLWLPSHDTNNKVSRNNASLISSAHI